MNANYRSIILTISIFFALPASISAAPGDLDPTFGVGGKVRVESGGSFDVAIQPNGKIVTVGLDLGGSAGPQIAVARYNSDGSPDTTFGGTGKVLIDHYQVAVDVAIQPDGKIVVASRDPDGDVFGELIRLNSDGSLDTSFGTNGIVAPLFIPSVAAILPDGKLLIASGATLFRLNANGSFDETFSECRPRGSSVHYAYRRSESVIQPDGRILTEFTAGNNDFGVFRCNSNGTLDTGFGSGGVVITSMSSGIDVAQSIALQRDGKIVVTGQSQSKEWSEWKFTVLRYNPNGSLDSGFGTGGILTTPTGKNFPYFPPPSKVVLQTDGKILVATTVVNGSSHFDLVRYNPDGSLDTTFTPITDSNDYAQSVAIQADGKIVVAGAGENGTDFYSFLVRYQGDYAGPTSCPNPIDCPDFFVRQHYRDFLNREPDAPGWAFWTGEITECNDPAKRQPGESLAECTDRKRDNTSAAFFLSPEFQNTGSFVLRVYWGTLGKLPWAQCGLPNGLLGSCRPLFSDYVADINQVAQGIVVNDQLAPDIINANKRAFVDAFVNRPAFKAKYDALSNTQFVDTLFATTGITPSDADRSALLNGLNNGTETRASVVFKVVDGTETIADGALVFQTSYGKAFFDQEFDAAFVFMEYIGYLRRNPDQEGFDFWLAKLKRYGNWLDAQMVRSFIVSPEYRSRFGQP